jgi:hypothetical protein
MRGEPVLVAVAPSLADPPLRNRPSRPRRGQGLVRSNPSRRMPSRTSVWVALPSWLATTTTPAGVTTSARQLSDGRPVLAQHRADRIRFRVSQLERGHREAELIPIDHRVASQFAMSSRYGTPRGKSQFPGALGGAVMVITWSARGNTWTVRCMFPARASAR